MNIKDKIFHFLIFISVIPLLLFLTTCSSRTQTIDNTTKPDPDLIYLTNEEPVLSSCLLPHLLEKSGLFIHYINGKYKDKNFYFESIIKITDETFKVVATTSINRLFSLSLGRSGEVSIESELSSVIGFQPEYIATDLALIYLPTATLRTCLPSNYSITETPLAERGFLRTISHKGATIFKITYYTADRYNSDVDLKNLLRNYQYSIKLGSQ